MQDRSLVIRRESPIELLEPTSLQKLIQSGDFSKYERKFLVKSTSEKSIYPNSDSLPTTASTLLVFEPENGFSAEDNKLLQNLNFVPIILSKKNQTLTSDQKPILYSSMLSEMYYPIELLANKKTAY